LRSRPKVGRKLAELVARATAVRPEDRFLDARSLELALSAMLARYHPEFTPATLGGLVREELAGAGHKRDVSGEVTSLIGEPVTIQSETSPPSTGGSTKAATRTVRQPARRRLRRVLVASTLVACILLAVSLAPSIKRAPPVAITSSEAVEKPEIVRAPGAPIATPREEPPKSAPAAATARPHVKAAAHASGFLTVTSIPWGELYVDGRLVTRETPLYRFRIPAGLHRVALRYRGQPDQVAVERVVITPGEVRMLGFRQ
jgi:hypothetical protein